MGTRARTFFRDKAVETDIRVVPGGIDSRRFQPGQDTPSADLILTGRLVQIKRIDIFLQAVACVSRRIPGVRAVIVGDGPLCDALRSLAANLDVERNIHFVGYQQDVATWLRKSRVFVLTSDSEGLSLSMMEAMMCGLPAVVSDVGDLGDLIEHGVNGYLVPRRSPQLLADRLVELLCEEAKRRAFSLAAHRSAMQYEKQATARRWDKILGDGSHCEGASDHG